MNIEERNYISSCLCNDSASIDYDVRIFHRWNDGLITSKEAYNKFIKRHNMDSDRLSIATFVEFMRGLGYGGIQDENEEDPFVGVSGGKGLHYIRMNLKGSWNAASSDAKIFKDWARNAISTELALAMFAQNNKMDASRISVESFVMFMNGLGYYNSQPYWKQKWMAY